MIKSTWKYRLVLVIMAASAGPIVATPTAAALGTAGTVSASQALALVNQERARAGCVSLRVVRKLQNPAEQQSQDQADRDSFSHDGANGSTSASRLGGLGYSRWGENVAQAQSAHAAVNFWAHSPRHRANMLNCVFTETGLALASSDSGRFYWTQTFGG
ncbi:MAG: CAP domain-containing protein [Pseudonocardiaceae bacterium]